MLEAEYGSCGRVAMFKSVAMVDADGNEVAYPRCDKCGAAKTFLIGKCSQMSICVSCESRSQPKDAMTKVFIDNLDRAAGVDG